MRKIILWMNLTLDGLIEGPEGRLDWMENLSPSAWSDLFGLMDSVDTILLGRVMYPGFQNYWKQIVTDPNSSMPENEIKLAHLIHKAQKIVFSKTLKTVDWENTKILKDSIVEEISRIKTGPGKDLILFGGASLATSLTNLGLIDEFIFLVNPVVLGQGKPLFKGVESQHDLKLLKAKAYESGVVALHYRAH